MLRIASLGFAGLVTLGAFLMAASSSGLVGAFVIATVAAVALLSML
jgi:hypothetical protein